MRRLFAAIPSLLSSFAVAYVVAIARFFPTTHIVRRAAAYLEG